LAGKTIPGFRIDPIWFGSSCVGYNCAGQPSLRCCCCRALQPLLLLLAAGTRTGARRKPYLVVHTLVFSSFYTHTHLECVVAGCCCFVCLFLLRPCVNYVIRSGHRLGSGWLVVYLQMGGWGGVWRASGGEKKTNNKKKMKKFRHDDQLITALFFFCIFLSLFIFRGSFVCRRAREIELWPGIEKRKEKLLLAI
jgi:hypothetical protein